VTGCPPPAGWPWPGDTELAIARKIAIAYREHLRAMARDRCDALDDVMRHYGQTWMLAKPVLYDDTDQVTTAQAAELVSRRPQIIRKWATTPHPTRPGEMLLPRFGWDGRSRTYLAGDVRAAAAWVTTHTTYRPHPG
jgi:hypothetical protein